MGDLLIKNFLEGYGLGPKIPRGVQKDANGKIITDPEELDKIARIQIEKAEKELEKKKELIKKINSNEQLLVGLQMPSYIKHYNDFHLVNGKSVTGESLEPKSYTSIVGNNPQRTRSHLLGIKGMDKFVNLDNAKLSSLIPKVRIFQEIRDSKGKVKGFAEMVFDDYQSADSITYDRGTRGSGAGIKEVSIDMEGDSIATSDRMYKVKMKLYFSSLEELFKKRTSPEGIEYQYVDLFKLLARDPTKVEQENLEVKIVRLEYGYHEPHYGSLSWTEAEKEALRESRRVMGLNLYKHNLDYNENGSLTLDLEYHGYIERSVTKVDVFRLGMTDEEKRAYDQAQGTLESMKKQFPPSASDSEKDKHISEKAKEAIDEQQERLAKQRTSAYQSLLNKVLFEKRLYSVGYAAQDKELPLLLMSDAKGKPTSDISKALLEPSAIDSFKKGASGDLPRKSVFFFYLGDMLDKVIELAKKEKEFIGGGFEFSFGSFYFKETEQAEPYEVPISGIPVSSDAFKEWFKENVQEKGERTTYDLASFLTDIVNLAVSAFSRESRLVPPPSGPSIRSATFTTSGAIEKGIIKEPYNSIPADKLKNGIQQKGLTENLFIYGINMLAEPERAGTRQDDERDGIYWLVAASENGVTKKISYSKADTKFLTEMRMTSDGFNDKKRILWSLYKANVDMVGNPIFKPGMLIYLTSNAFSQQDADDLGLGGYFMVLKVRNSIQDGKFKTELETIWTKPTRPTGKTKGKTGPQ